MGLSLKTTTGKVLASVGLVATAAAVAGLGTYGSWTTTTSASADVTAGKIGITLNGATGVNGLAVSVDGMLPGDKVERLVVLQNTGNQSLSAVTLTTEATQASLLTGDSGLKMQIDKCSVPWVQQSAGASYTCSGTTGTVLASGKIIGVDRPLSGLSALAAAGTDNLKVTASMPEDAPGTFQGLSSTVNFSFTATQRAATVK